MGSRWIFRRRFGVSGPNINTTLLNKQTCTLKDAEKVENGKDYFRPGGYRQVGVVWKWFDGLDASLSSACSNL